MLNLGYIKYTCKKVTKQLNNNTTISNTVTYHFSNVLARKKIAFLNVNRTELWTGILVLSRETTRSTFILFGMSRPWHENHYLPHSSM
jgi:hypothetical protein